MRSIPIAGGGRAHVPQCPLVAMPFLDTPAPPRADRRSRSHPAAAGGSVDHPCGRSSRGAIDAFQPTAAARSSRRRRPRGAAGRGTCARTATSAVRAPRSAAREEEGRAWRGGRVDAQADMPLDEPRAQVAFKDSMIRGILQFTLRIAFRCVLHRCKSQDIRC